MNTRIVVQMDPRDAIIRGLLSENEELRAIAFSDQAIRVNSGRIYIHTVRGYSDHETEFVLVIFSDKTRPRSEGVQVPLTCEAIPNECITKCILRSNKTKNIAEIEPRMRCVWHGERGKFIDVVYTNHEKFFDILEQIRIDKVVLLNHEAHKLPF